MFVVTFSKSVFFSEDASLLYCVLLCVKCRGFQLIDCAMRCRYAEGDVYKGEWRDDKRHGKGTVTYVTPKGGILELYEGDWVNGMLIVVVYIFFSKLLLYIHNLGKMHGFGKYVYMDGGVYTGDWVEGRMHGKGVYLFPNGNSYDGEWVNDKKEGYVEQAAVTPAVRRPVVR